MFAEYLPEIIVSQAVLIITMVVGFGCVVLYKTKCEHLKLQQLLRKVGKQQIKALSKEQVNKNASSYLTTQYESVKTMYGLLDTPQGVSMEHVVNDPSTCEEIRITALRLMFLEAEKTIIDATKDTEEENKTIVEKVYRLFLTEEEKPDS